MIGRSPPGHLKPRLIKFTCPACNARLAVPDAMAGMEDNCPKCGARIKAPLPEPEPAKAADPKPAAATQAAPGKSRHGILDAVLHAPEPARKAPLTTKPQDQESAASPTEPEASRPTLFDEFLSAAPLPPKQGAADAPPAGTPILRLKPLVAAKPVRGTEIKTAPPAPPASPPVPEITPTAAPAPPTLREIISAAEPKPVAAPPAPDDELQPSALGPGPLQTDPPGIDLSETIADQPIPPSPAVNRDGIPSLGVGLMQVEDRPHQNPLRRRRLVIAAGILLFLLFDAAVFCWIFRHRIYEWWQERQPVAVTQQAAASPAAPASTASAPPLKPAATPAIAASGNDPARSPTTTPPPPGQETKPEKPVAELVPSAPPPAKTADAPTLDGLPPSSPAPAANLGAQPAPGAREVGDIPGKKEFSAEQLGSPAPPSPPASDPPNPPATKDLLTTLDVPLLITPSPAQAPAADTKDDLKAKVEIAPPPAPPSLPLIAAIPEAMAKPPASETAPTLPVTADGDVSTAPAKIVESGVITAARPALAALKSFLAAPTWQERLRWAQKPDTVKAAMEKHYRKHPDGPIKVARIDFIERYPARSGNPPYCMFEVRGGDLKRSILVLVEEKSKADIRVDWEVFAEFKDELLQEFLGKPGSPPGKFRVMIRRSHSFEKSVPDLDRKDAFELSQPGLDLTTTAYALKGATAARALSQQLGWGESIAVTIQLAWRSEGKRSWVEVTAVPAFGWRG